MSIQEQRNEPNTSAQAIGGSQLTAANLDAHNRNTSTVPAGHAVRSWFVDSETWAELVERDQLAADIEATMHGGNQSGAGQR
jgi:hypothetical protein